MAELKNIIDTLDNAADSFESIATKEQKKLFDEVLTLAKDLETDTLGKVKQTIGNLKRLTQIKAKLAALAKDKDWAAGIAKFAQYFGTLQKLQNEYYSQHFPEATFSETAKKKNELMKQLAVQNTIEALMGDGLKANVTDKLNDILLRAVTTGAKYSDLQEELRAHLLGKDSGQGALVRYTTTYATTALSQYTGQHNKLLTDDLDTEWFMYTGSNKETTREFCEHLTAKKYIHRSEIPTILTGKIDDYQCAIYPKTNLPYGMIEGTTPENFQCNCGGWNCRHQLVPVADAVVPAALRAKFPNKERQKIISKKAEEVQQTNAYNSVRTNKQGGLKAVHESHNIEKKGRDDDFFNGLTSGELELECQKILFEEGHQIILEGEKEKRANGEIIACLDSTFDGRPADIKSITTNVPNYRNAIVAKNRQIAKRKIDVPQFEADTLILHFHDKSLFSEDKVRTGYKKSVEYANKYGVVPYIHRIICTIDGIGVKMYYYE